MHNLLLMKKTPELEQLSIDLGFTKTIFLNDIAIIKAETKKQLGKIRSDTLTIFRPQTEELLRYALEKSNVKLIYGMELINPKDSVHFVRGGLDQITCKIAAKNDKIIGFSFSDILNAKNRPRLMARMIANIKLCKKYKVKTYFGNFSSTKLDQRAAKDLQTFCRMLGGINSQVL